MVEEVASRNQNPARMTEAARPRRRLAWNNRDKAIQRLVSVGEETRRRRMLYPVVRNLRLSSLNIVVGAMVVVAVVDTVAVAVVGVGLGDVDAAAAVVVVYRWYMKLLVVKLRAVGSWGTTHCTRGIGLLVGTLHCLLVF